VRSANQPPDEEEEAAGGGELCVGRAGATLNIYCFGFGLRLGRWWLFKGFSSCCVLVCALVLCCLLVCVLVLLGAWLIVTIALCSSIERSSKRKPGQKI
jgi:lysylphosphatidylglycerol synthetase-like protein (DUF2156 family)